jgi:hypothetical protein
MAEQTEPERAPGGPTAARPVWVRARKWLAGARLVHFLVLGGGLFVLAPPPVEREVIRLPAETLEVLVRAEARRLGVAALSPEQVREVTLRALEDEVLYREALRLGLDREDGVVRQRLVQKTLFLAEELGATWQPPTQEELQAFHAAEPERWQQPLSLRLIHVYASEQRGPWLESLREQVLAADATAPESAPALGEPFPLSRKLPLSSLTELEQAFGGDFARAVSELPPGTWSQPVRSKYGWHLVKVLERREPAPAPYEQVRERVAFQYVLERRRRATSEWLRQAFSRYRVEVEGQPLEGYVPTGRAASNLGEGN